MRGGAVRMFVASEMRRSAGAFALTVAVAALAGGAALTAAAGARRSDSAYARFLTWAHPADFGTGGGTDDKSLTADIAAIEKADFAAVAAHVPVVGAHVRLPDGRVFQPFQVAVVADQDNVLARGTIDREKVLRGRRADPASPTDATVSFAAADRLGVGLGSRITLVPDEGGHPIAVRVVGVVVRVGEFPTLTGSTGTSIAVTSGFERAHPALFTPGNDGLIVRVKPGIARADVEHWLRTNLHGTDIEDASISDAPIERTIRLETVALWAVAAVLALVFSVLLWQLLFRQAIAGGDDMAILITLGLTRRQVTQVGVARGALAGIVAAIGAGVIAVVASPLTPVGLGRLAEPRPGFWVDARVLFVGLFAIILLATLFGAAAARRSRLLSRSESRPVRRALRLPNVAPAIRAALQILLRPTQRRDARLTRTTIASLCVIVAGATTVIVMLTSLSHLRRTPALAGATWDAALVFGDNPSDRALDAAYARLAADPTVSAYTGSGWTVVVAGGREVPVQVFDDGGRIGPAIAAGRAPAAKEIALGADEMHRLGVGIGDRLRIAAQPGARALDVAVVGRTVLVPPIFRPAAPGDGGALTTSTMRRLGVKRVDAAGLALVRFAPGRDVGRALDRTARALGADFAFSSTDRTIVGGVKRVQTAPTALIIVLAVLGAAAFLHLQLLSTRRRRRDIAVLCAIGFTRRQVVTMVVVQALGIALVAFAIGVPLGLIAGRIGWIRFADYIRVVARPATSPFGFAAVAVCLLVIALAAGAVSGVRAAAVRPARVLHERS